MQVSLAKAVVAAGGVKDVGLELWADWLIVGEGHGGSSCSLIAEMTKKQPFRI